jgi:hypothetical protein
VPSLVFESAVVGFAAVLHTTPRAVSVPPPSSVTLPPALAAIELMPLAAVVVTTGRSGKVVKVASEL